MAPKLVIVESPAKARTLGHFLGKDYQVKACLGHVRDLPRSRIGVDVEQDFLPEYELVAERREVVKELKGAARRAPAIYLATDPDREGEAISWHLVQATGLDGKPVHRVTFHEITPQAVAQAFRHPRDIDLRLVEAQQTRRILDRLVGYRLSPLLWRKVRRGLSAGRVQSAALRLVAEREREVTSFVPQEYWLIEAELAKLSQSQTFTATLAGIVGQRARLSLHNEKEATEVVGRLNGAHYQVAQVARKKGQRNPPPPFITSTLQQEAWRKLRFSAQRTMAVAQQLYEGLALGAEGTVGLITYMRTDSTHVAPQAREDVRSYIVARYGQDYLSPSPRVFRSKVAGAQEAHEAIRPTAVDREPARVGPFLSRDQFRLYDLVWKRMVASQMASARLETTTVDIQAQPPARQEAFLFRASGTVIQFPGFISLYQESQDEPGEEDGTSRFPPLQKGDALDLRRLTPLQKFTQPPPRYTEASLVKALEEKGIGRPSTYAPILATIQQRDYVERIDGRLKATALGLAVSDLLIEHFPQVMDLSFTARMETELDDIARGDRERVPLLRDFYHPFDEAVRIASEAMPRVKITEPAGEDCPNCGRPMLIKYGRFGQFVACSGFPECRTAKPLLTKAAGRCPECDGEVVRRRAKGKGKRSFWGCLNYPKCKFSTFRSPLSQPCPRCGSLVVAQGRSRDTGQCLKCGNTVAKAGPQRGAA